jgi:hypothetical protein
LGGRGWGWGATYLVWEGGKSIFNVL